MVKIKHCQLLYSWPVILREKKEEEEKEKEKKDKQTRKKSPPQLIYTWPLFKVLVKVKK